MEIEFQNLKDLYDRLSPALSSKVADLKRNDYVDVDNRDVWNFLANTKWMYAKDLLLHQMVNDIFAADNEEIYQYKLNSRIG